MVELFRSPRRAIVWFVEASVLALLTVLTAGLMTGWTHALGQEQVLRAVVVAVVAQGSMYYHGLYGMRPMRHAALMAALVRALLMAAGVIWIASRVLPEEPTTSRALGAALCAAAVVLPAWRLGWQKLEQSESFRRPALILGDGPLARACAALIEGEPTGLRIAGVLAAGSTPIPGAPTLGGLSDVARVARERGVAHVIVACEERRGVLPIEALLELELAGVEVEDGPSFFERVSGQVFIPALKPSDLLFDSAFQIGSATRCGKRALDVVAAGIGLVLSLPLLTLGALAIKLDSPGPVFYSQLRAGARGRPFLMRKLRSMRTDAEARGATWAAEDDPRVTRVGRFLRRTRIDEIPQLWNVLRGEMSLVGPRPERPIFAAEIERQVPLFRQRLRVKPGVTGHAQVRCRYGASIDDAREKLAYDIFYIKSLSLWFDLSILVDTVKVVLLRIGSR